MRFEFLRSDLPNMTEKILGENEGAIKAVSNPTNTYGTKPMDARHHQIRNVMDEENIE